MVLRLAGGLLACSLCLAAPAARAADEVQPSNFVLNNAQQFSLRAKSNGREYRIFVSAPAGEAPAGGYPVIYTSDGNAMFPLLSSVANILRMHERSIIVGIGYPGDGVFDPNRRYFDLTPPTPPEVVRASVRAVEGRPAPETGGCETFYQFIEQELKPLIASRYKVDAQRQTLFGHSLGGLFVLNVLFKHPEAFQTYVAAAPSIWWNNQDILKSEPAFTARQAREKSKLRVLIVANHDVERERDAPPAALATNPRLAASGGGEELYGRLKVLEGIEAGYRMIEDESHMSMVPAAVARALVFSLGAPRRQGAGPRPQGRR